MFIMLNPTKILTQLDTERLKSQLESYPDKILNQKSVVRSCRDAYRDAEQDRSVVVAEIMAEIGDAKDPKTGKSMFSNTESRQAELAKRQRTNSDYQAAAKAARETEQQLNRAEDELEALQNKFKSLCFVAELVAQEVALWANNQGPQPKPSPEPY
jgi:multidrug efflux pump subunit AcrA (membrane-fusion protein)